MPTDDTNPQGELSSQQAQSPLVLAVIVLYGMAAEDSPAFTSLERIRASTPALQQTVDLLLWDNSPPPAGPPPGYTSHYHHAPANPGLCEAYNSALRTAVSSGIPWLLLLDQDTTLTTEYLQEALATLETTPAAAIVPRLEHGGVTVSPFFPRAFGPHSALKDDVYGPVSGLQAFNSGALLRVSAMQALGGFDEAFPLDYLDHATFCALQRSGGTVFVMRARLPHELSTHTSGKLDRRALNRHKAILAAERRFIKRYGTTAQRRMMPVRTLRHILSVLIHKHDLHHALLILKTALVRS